MPPPCVTWGKCPSFHLADVNWDQGEASLAAAERCRTKCYKACDVLWTNPALSRPWENPWHREPKGDPAHFAGAACSQLGEEIMRSIQGWNGWGWAPIESLRLHQGALQHVPPSPYSSSLLVVESLWVLSVSQSGDLSISTPLATWEETDIRQSIMNYPIVEMGSNHTARAAFKTSLLMHALKTQNALSFISGPTSCSKLATKTQSILGFAQMFSPGAFQ